MRSQYLVFTLLIVGFNYRINGDDTCQKKTAEYDGNSSEEDFYCPCENNDRECVYNHIRQNSVCDPIKPNTDIVTREIFEMELSVFNLSIVYSKNTMTGLDCEIKKFCLNKKTNMYVFDGEYKDYTINMTDARFLFHRLGQEPVVVKDVLRAKYFGIRVLAQMPYDPKCGIDVPNTRTSAQIFNLQPDFYVGKNIWESKLPQVKVGWGSLVEHLDMGLRMTVHRECRSMFFATLQKYCCNYHQPISMYG